MFACPTGTGVINNGIECRKRCGAVGPDICSLDLRVAWREHLSQSLIGIDIEAVGA